MIFLKSETRCQHMKPPHSPGFWDFLAVGLALNNQKKIKQTNKQKQKN